MPCGSFIAGFKKNETNDFNISVTLRHFTHPSQLTPLHQDKHIPGLWLSLTQLTVGLRWTGEHPGDSGLEAISSFSILMVIALIFHRV